MNLSPRRRSQIAKGAALARWRPVVRVSFDDNPRTPAEVENYVANFGAAAAMEESLSSKADLADVACRALELCRQAPHVARMMPVFFHRLACGFLDMPEPKVFPHMDLGRLREAVQKSGLAGVYGYFCEVTSKLSPAFAEDWNADFRSMKKATAESGRRKPEFFFRRKCRGDLEAKAVKATSCPLALEWGFYSREPFDSFKSYFAKTSVL